MTRSAWVTVRLPGARTAPPTSTRIWFQTGAVKHGRKTASHDTRIVGTVGLVGRQFDAIVCHRIRRIESPRSCKSHSTHGRIRLRRLCGCLLGYDLTASPMKLRKAEPRICPISTFPRRRRSCSCRTISAPTSQRHSTRHSLLPKRAGSSNGSSGITRRGMAVGSIWQTQRWQRGDWCASNMRPITSCFVSPVCA